MRDNGMKIWQPEVASVHVLRLRTANQPFVPSCEAPLSIDFLHIAAKIESFSSCEYGRTYSSLTETAISCRTCR